MEKALYITRSVYSRQACICKHSHTTCEILNAHLNILDVLVAERSAEPLGPRWCLSFRITSSSCLTLWTVKKSRYQGRNPKAKMYVE
jgi:hypothetical protein